MGTHQEKVFVAVGNNVEEGLGILKWALSQWSSPSFSFVILHLNSTSKDFVQTPFGKLPTSSVNDLMLEDLDDKENDRVDKLLSKYTSFCCKVKAEVLKVDTCEGPVYQILAGLISSLGIKKLVMGFKNTKSLSWKAKGETSDSFYIHKNKPDSCELFIVCGGKLVKIKEENADEGFYFVDESGAIIADLRKKLKEKGSFTTWLSRKMTDTNLSPHNAVSASNESSLKEEASLKFEDNVEEIERYIECLLASNSPELELGDETMDQIEVANTNISSLSRTEILRAIEQAEKMVEQSKCEIKANEERRRKAEWSISLCNQRAEQVEADFMEELMKQATINEELGEVGAELNEIAENISRNKCKLHSELDQQDKLMSKIQAHSIEKAWIVAAITEVENKKAEMLQEIEEIRKQGDFIKRRMEYDREREVMEASKELSFRYRDFSEEELREATDNFSEEVTIDSGLEGAVFRGRINNTSVAIQFKPELMESFEEFKAQVEVLRNINHPNILTMIGACTKLRCIVFEDMHNGTLQDILKDHPLLLPWNERVRIASNICSAIGFLHSSMHMHMNMHGRLTSTHVLLDHNFSAKITSLHAFEIASLGKMIFELVTGNEAVGVQEVRLAVEGETLVEILDERAGDWPLDIATELVKIGLRCFGDEIRDEEGVARYTGDVMKEVGDLQVKAEEKVVHGGDERKKINIPEVFLCPIYQEVMKDPYVAADGFSYELEAIKTWFSTGHVTSPMTNLKVNNKVLTPNHTLQCLIRDWHNN